MQQTAYARIAYERQAKRRGGAGTVRRAKTLVDLLKDFLRGLTIFLFNQVGVCVLLTSYNVIGAFTFRAIEGVNGDPSIEDKAALAQNLTINHIWNLTLRLNVLEERLWRKEVEVSVEDYQHILVPLIRWKNYRGVRPIDAWTIPGALMYSLSIYTTIGYGNLTPRTDAGKVATIFYALLGMPLMLLYMSNVGEILANSFKFLYFRVCSCGLKTISNQRILELKGSSTIEKKKEETDGALKWKAVNFSPKEETKQDSESENGKETIPILWCLVVISIYVLCGGVLFAHWEGWTALDGCYFCYISLSTVGFGDMVPGKVLTDDDGDATDVETIQILATIYLLVGMALVAMCFNLMQEEALQNVKAFWRSLGCLRRSKPMTRVRASMKERAKSKELAKQGRVKPSYDRTLAGYYARVKENAFELQPLEKMRQFKNKISLESSFVGSHL